MKNEYDGMSGVICKNFSASNNIIAFSMIARKVNRTTRKVGRTFPS